MSAPYGGYLQRGGRLETRLAYRGTGSGAGVADAQGNGSRVAILLSLAVTSITDPDAWAQVYTTGRGGNLPIATLTAGLPTIVLRYEDIGDLVYSPLSVSASPLSVAVTIWEVVWHPEES